MARLLDMEELLLKIDSKEKREFMEEALICYMNKAYRGCIVLSFIVLFEDIFDKLKPLTFNNTLAKEVYDFIKPKKDKQQVFENDLINKLQTYNLIDRLDADFATIIIKLRNKSAHPSGHLPSSEEARYIFTEVINRFLTQPILSTNTLVDSILNNLESENFFIDNSMKSIQEVVNFEICKLHKTAIPYLIDKLIENYNNEEPVFHKNINFFISGLTRILDPEYLEIIKEKIIEKKSTDNSFNLLILKLIGLKPELFKKSEKITQERIKILLTERITNVEETEKNTAISHPLYIIKSLYSIYEANDFNKYFEKIIDEVLKKWPYEKEIKYILTDNEILFNHYFNLIVEDAGSRTFSLANDFIVNISEFYKIANDLISEKQSLELIINIVDAANNGARKSITFVNGNFNAIPEIYKKANDFIKNNNSDYEDLCKKNYVDSIEFKEKYFP